MRNVRKTRPVVDDRRLASLMVMLALALCAGCWSSDAHVDDSRDAILAKLHQESLNHPTSLEHLGSAEGVEPSGEIARGVTIATEDGETTLEDAVVTHGPSGDAYRDVKTGRLAWKALTCTSPDCASSGPEPYLFIHELPGARIDDRGYVKANIPDDAFIPECPICGRRDTIREYMHPDVVRRRAELDVEIKLARAARKAGHNYPAGVRSPREIMNERVLLPRLYLVPED